MHSRLDSERAFLAPYYKLLFPMVPAAVRACRPSEIASILGLDLDDAVRVVPLEDAPFVPRVGDPGARRLREVR